MYRIRKYYFQIIIALLSFMIFFIKYEIVFLMSTVTFAIIMTYFISNFNKDILIIRYDSYRLYQLEIMKMIIEKSFFIAFMLGTEWILMNLIYDLAIPIHYFLLFVLYFLFFITLSQLILLYKCSLKKTLIILVLMIIPIYITNPVIIFSHILVNDTFWINQTYLILSCAFWSFISLVCGILNYHMRFDYEIK